MVHKKLSKIDSVTHLGSEGQDWHNLVNKCFAFIKKEEKIMFMGRSALKSEFNRFYIENGISLILALNLTS